MTTSGHAFQPDYASPPGATLRELMAEQAISQVEFAARAGMSSKHANQIMQGVAAITLETAIVLERVTGVPASFWNRREADYREALLRASAKAPTEADIAWMDSLPIKELQKRGRLPAGKDRRQLYEAVLSFFGVADRDAWERIWSDPVPAFRRSQAFMSSQAAVIAWLRIGQLEAQQIQVSSYSAATFRQVLHEIRALTADGDPNEIVEMCAAAGVAVVFVREIKDCRISGAAWWASPTRAVIALSDRYKADDRFWFTFFHEAAHLLLHSKKETFVDADGKDDGDLEEEANRWARDFLIPPDRIRELSNFVDDDDVEEFSRELGIAPGIVVGRMQHDRIWTYRLGNALKRKIEIVEN